MSCGKDIYFPFKMTKTKLENRYNNESMFPIIAVIQFEQY